MRSTGFDTRILKKRSARFLGIGYQTRVLKTFKFPALKIKGGFNFFDLMSVISRNNNSLCHRSLHFNKELQNNMLNRTERHAQHSLAKRAKIIKIIRRCRKTTDSNISWLNKRFLPCKQICAIKRNLSSRRDKFHLGSNNPSDKCFQQWKMGASQNQRVNIATTQRVKIVLSNLLERGTNEYLRCK